jgi:hypothetical protein
MEIHCLQHFSSVENDTRNVWHFNEIKLGQKIFLIFVVHSPYSPSTEYDNRQYEIGKKLTM